MVGISRLYLGTAESSDRLRYTGSHGTPVCQAPRDKRPVVILGVTRRCNLRCVHCYAGSGAGDDPADLSTTEWKRIIDDLAAFGSPVALFSGGEPLMRPDLPELAAHAVSRGMRATISSNGTLITPGRAEQLADIGLAYIGVSLDGMADIHDGFRGVAGAFERSLTGIRNARDAGIKTGIRFTMTARNVDDIPAVFDLMERERIPRICFYHLVETGRGGGMAADALFHERTRETLDLIIDRTADLHRRGMPVEVLTVDNHADGPYLYLRMLREGNPRAGEVRKLLARNGGNTSGAGVGAINWDGEVYPDQFWRTRVLGNVRERAFGDIWTDPDNDFLMRLKDKKRHVTGRCATCRFLDLCGGNFRARAEALTGDTWAPDPACHLTDGEIRDA